MNQENNSLQELSRLLLAINRGYLEDASFRKLLSDFADTEHGFVSDGLALSAIMIAAKRFEK